MKKEKTIKDSRSKTRINEDIRVREVRVIDEKGNQLGVMDINQALKIARDRGYDLIEVAPNSKPPVCKIGDFGKFNYEKQKKEKEQKKSKTSSQVKEIRFHPNTDTHDLEFKSRHLKEFLIDGYKVKATIIFIGRMMVHQEIGRKLLDDIVEKLTEVGKIEQPPKLEGRHMTTLLIPDKKKIEQYLKNLKKQTAEAEVKSNQISTG
ncbi:MAG: translation initiation factor IF-3 [Ignavibacteria bacterium]